MLTQEIFARRYSEDEYEMLPPKYTILVSAQKHLKMRDNAFTKGTDREMASQEKEVTKSFGTVLACIAFTSYLNPIMPIAGTQRLQYFQLCCCVPDDVHFCLT